MNAQDPKNVLPDDEDFEEERAGARPEDFEEVFGQGDEFEPVSMGEVVAFEDEDTNPGTPAFEGESNAEELAELEEFEELEKVAGTDQELEEELEELEKLEGLEEFEEVLIEPEAVAPSEAAPEAAEGTNEEASDLFIPEDYNLLEVDLEFKEAKAEELPAEPELPFFKRLLAEHPRLPHGIAVVLLAPLALWASMMLEGDSDEPKVHEARPLDAESEAKKRMLARFTNADRDEAVTAKDVKDFHRRSAEREANDERRRRIEEAEQKQLQERNEALKNRSQGAYKLSPGQLADPQNLPETTGALPSSGVGVVVGGVPERGVSSRRARQRAPTKDKPVLFIPRGSIAIKRSQPIGKAAKAKGDQVKGLRPGDLLRVRLVDGISSQEGGPVIAELVDSFARSGRYILPAETLLRGTARPGDRRFFIEFTEAFVSGRWRKLKGRAVEGGRPGIKAKQRKVTLDARSSAGIARGLVDTTAAVVSGVGGVAGRAAGAVAREVAPEVKEDVTPKEVTILETAARYRFSVRILR